MFIIRRCVRPYVIVLSKPFEAKKLVYSSKKLENGAKNKKLHEKKGDKI